jgi:hypothetical protein
MSIPRKLGSLLAGGALAATFAVTAATNASAATTNGSCSGGTVAAGTYGNLTITGFCMLDGGNVTVQHNVKVTSTGALDAMFSESTLTIGGNLIVDTGGLLALGCDPVESACMDNPNGTSSHSVGHNLIADGAVLMIVHDNHIGGNVEQEGGGGGFSCNVLFPNGPPAFTDYANNTIGGQASVTGLRTCWDGFSHNVVAGNVQLSDNQTAIPDGNLVDGNHIGRNLSCTADTPAPHLSDGPIQILNVVGGKASGQCAAIST